MKRASSSEDQKLLQILKEMEALQAQYPEELLSSRRASFLEQVEQSTVAREERLSSQDQRVIDQLRNLGSTPAQYPPPLLAARRSTFVRQIAWLNFVSMVAGIRQAVQKRIPLPDIHWRMPASRALPSSLLVAGLVMAAFMGFIFYANQKSPSSLSQPQHGSVQSGRIMAASPRAVRIICKPGAQPPLCLAGEYKQDVGQALAYQGNGSARPAVAKDTMSAGGGVHKAAFVNDGLYGPGASWISNSRNSWIKIDLGKPTKVNTVTFGRDRLGKLNGHNPGQFEIALALYDNVYADGNNSKDNEEYQTVFNSKQAGFSGRISGADTVVAQFVPRDARYIKITFENKGTAIDEVEAFMKQPPLASGLSSGASRDKNKDKDETTTNPSGSQVGGPISPPLAVTSSPAIPTTSIPTTSIPTETLGPSDTATPIPTATDIPTNTPVPTSTAVPTSTSAPVNTPTTVPSDTPPPPISTPVPQDTTTPAPADLGLPTGISPKIDYFDYKTSVPSNP